MALTPQQIQEARNKIGTNKLPSEATGSSLLARLQGREETLAQDVKSDFLSIGKDIISGSQKRAENIQDIRAKKEAGTKGTVPALFEIGGQLAGAGADAIGSVFKGAVKLALTPKAEAKTKELVTQFGQEVVSRPEVQSVIKWYDALPEDKKDALDAVGGFASLAGEFVGVGAGQKAVKAGVNTAKQGAKAVANTTTNIIDSIPTTGIGQIATDIAERVPRAITRGKEKIAENAIKAEKIKTATPEVKQALKVNLDERIVNTVSQADDDTRKAFKDVFDIAEETPKTIGTKKQPSLVGGELAVKQFDIINKQKKAVGEKIGELTKSLSKTKKLDMQDSFRQIDDTLSEQGIIPTYTKKGVKLDFTGSKYTPAERTKIQQLYNLATEGGDTLSPSKIKEKDQLFSKLKRESNFEGIGDLIIETPEGNKSLFNVFRDIYSSKLDTISPEVKKLNSEYRQYAQIVEDIEDSIFKTPNFNVTKTKGVDPAEFAKVNMRRIFGEAQSSPVFEAVADIMDKASRGLGYKGATPKQVAEFAEYLRKLYPESVPKTGFQGGIKAGLSDIIETVTSVGAPNVKDQREALRLLLSPKKK